MDGTIIFDPNNFFIKNLSALSCVIIVINYVWFCYYCLLLCIPCIHLYKVTPDTKPKKIYIGFSRHIKSTLQQFCTMSSCMTLCSGRGEASTELTFWSYEMPIYGNSLLHRLKDLLEVSIIFWNVNCSQKVSSVLTTPRPKHSVQSVSC